MAEIKELNAANFDETVKSGVVLVDFWLRGAIRAGCSGAFSNRSRPSFRPM